MFRKPSVCPIYGCHCMQRLLLYLCAYVCLCCYVSPALSTETCIVNRRLPSFGLGIRRTQTRDMQRSTVSGSRNVDGVCHMRRLALVNNTLPVANVPGAKYSIQTCTASNTTLTCAMLRQNLSHPAESKVDLQYFPLTRPSDAVYSSEKKHTRRAQCTSCVRANLTKVLTRLLDIVSVNSTVKEQLSFGVPHRISTERLIAAHLHRSLCGANKTCAALQGAVGCTTCLHRGKFLPAILKNLSLPSSTLPSTDALWSRNWVSCPHHDKQSGDGTDPAVNIGSCKGSVSKTEWLNPLTRNSACARELTTSNTDSTTTMNFCLLNSETERLCLKMSSWLQRNEFYLCQAAGLCEDSDFFYSPTTFNLQEQEFVYDTVQRFYTEDAGITCPSKGNVNIQVQANEALLEKCSSVTIAPFLLIVEQLRAGKRSIAVVLYHAVRVGGRLIEVFLAVTLDAGTSIANQAGNAIQVAAEALLKDVKALMFVLGDFVEQIGAAVMELAMSKGVGSWFKELIMVLCKIVWYLYNGIWAKILCPVVQFLLEFVGMVVDVWEMIVNIMRSLFIPVDVLQTFIEFTRNLINVISSSLNECAYLPVDFCALGVFVSAETNARGTLPMPTRCWSSYVTFFGDNQELSCTAADTCKLGSLTSEKIMCGACPTQTNPNIQDFACDHVTSICTCAVPQYRESSCLVNEDCMSVDDETSCMLINDDLQVSKSAILCNQCQFQSMCFHNELGDSGVCACGTRQRAFQTCSPQDARTQNSLSLMLNNLCIVSPASSQFHELEFAQTSVIACMQLDPTTATCAYVVDSNMFIVRGNTHTGRRLLSSADVTYSSLDSSCRDALVSENLPFTRAACQANFQNSRATLKLLGLERQLPPCTFCSLTDIIDATRSNPISMMRMLINGNMLLTVLRRHGPTEKMSQLFLTLHTGLAKAVQRLSDKDAASVVSVHTIQGATIVQVDDTVFPAVIARALEAWILEMITQNITRAPQASGVCNETTCSNFTNLNSDLTISKQPNRRLLLFQELVMAIETRVRDGWDQADRLHEAFAESINQILTYRNIGQEQTLAEQQWGRESMSTREDCQELAELVKITMRVTNGVRLGWLTLTHERNNLQRKPAETLRDAWPKLVELDADDQLPEFSTENTNDMLVQLASDTVNVTLDALDIRPTVFYNFIFSVASALNTSFSCPYEAVQTCSGWQVRLWQGLVIVIFYFCVVSLIINFVGLSFISALFVPFFSLFLWQLCYGYTWTCLPMIPVCAFQDLTESINILLPLTLELPDDLKKTDPACLELCPNSDIFSKRLCFRRYPSANCTKSCKDSPFAYTSASSVAAWIVVEIGPAATNYALNQSKFIPFFQYEKFKRELLSHTVTLQRGSEEFLRAHRLCAGLSSYMLFPYILLIVLVIGLISTMITLLASQIYPVLVFVFSLFTAASAGPKNSFYKTEKNDLKQQENDFEDDNENNTQSVIDIF